MPFNIASYALLTHLVAHVCNLDVGDFVHSFGDVHVYSNHVEAMREQLKREPLPLPSVEIDSRIKEIDDIRSEHILLKNYHAHSNIPMKMAV